MYHDQGHIPVKVAAPRRSSAISIGAPVLFGSVAHGSAHDIAGRNRADPAAFMNALELLTAGFGAAN
jgi:4-hydroxythreonine-4-phosphate dehydrogenase